MSYPIVQIKRRKTINDTSAGESTINGLLYGELGYISDTGNLYIGPPAGKSAAAVWLNVKNTAGATNLLNTKLFLIGATGQGAYPQTYTNGNIFITNANKLSAPFFTATGSGIGFEGQATTASKWHTARTVTFTGAVSGSFTIDGSGNVSAALGVSDEIKRGYITDIIPDAKNLNLISWHFGNGQEPAQEARVPIIRAISDSWTAGSTAGPVHVLNINGVGKSMLAIPSASDTASGVVTTGGQNFAGNKTFTGIVSLSNGEDANISNNAMLGALRVTGGVNVGKQLWVTGATVLRAALSVTGGIVGNSTLTVSGDTTLNKLTANAAAVLNSTLSVTSIATFNNNIILNGDQRNIQLKPSQGGPWNILSTYAGDANGVGLVFGNGGGRVIIGSGESANGLHTALGVTAANEADESLHLGSDGTISIHSNCQTIASRKTWIFTIDGNIQPPTGGQFLGNATSATSATVLTTNAGSASIPIYFSAGKPVQCNTTLGVNITGSATALTTNAGSASIPIYFSAGKPVQCNTTLGVNITGNANTASSLASNTRIDYGWNGLQYFNASLAKGGAAKANDAPNAGWHHIIRCNHANSGGYYFDLALPFHQNTIWYKRVVNGSVQNSGWVELLDKLNFNNYAPTKTGGGASGNWNINAATATNLKPGRSLIADLTNHGNAISLNASSSVDYQINIPTSGTLDVAHGGTNGTTVAAAVKNLAPSIFPVGYIFITTSRYTADANGDITTLNSLFGGTWKLFSEGRMLLGATASQLANNNPVAGTSGGSTVTGNTNSANSGSTVLTVNQIPAHTHTEKYYGHSIRLKGGSWQGGTSGNNAGWTVANSISTPESGSTGGGQGHTHSITHTHNLSFPPYTLVYMYRRIG